MADVPHSRRINVVDLVELGAENGYLLGRDPNLSISSGVGVRELEDGEAADGWRDA